MTILHQRPREWDRTAPPAISVEEQLRQRTAELQTALREAQRTGESLRESEAQFRSMAHNSLLGISIIVDGKYTYTNAVQNELLGYSADEMLLIDPLATSRRAIVPSLPNSCVKRLLPR